MLELTSNRQSAEVDRRETDSFKKIADRLLGDSVIAGNKDYTPPVFDTRLLREPRRWKGVKRLNDSRPWHHFREYLAGGPSAEISQSDLITFK